MPITHVKEHCIRTNTTKINCLQTYSDKNLLVPVKLTVRCLYVHCGQQGAVGWWRPNLSAPSSPLPTMPRPCYCSTTAGPPEGGVEESKKNERGQNQDSDETKLQCLPKQAKDVKHTRVYRPCRWVWYNTSVTQSVVNESRCLAVDTVNHNWKLKFTLGIKTMWEKLIFTCILTIISGFTASGNKESLFLWENDQMFKSCL